MTIRGRNRLLFAGFIFSILTLSFYIGLTIIQFMKGAITLQDLIPLGFYNSFYKTPDIFEKYSQFVFFISIVFEVLYCSILYKVLISGFEKTQSPNLVYFALFALSFIFDSSRILIPLFNIQEVLSKALIGIGRVVIFARILGPISLLCTNLLNSDELRQELDRNCIIIIITSMFFASKIPLNTTTLHLNFTVSYAYATTIKITLLIFILINIFTLFIYNKERDYHQKTTIGFLILSTGYYHLFYNETTVSYVVGMICLAFGTHLYMKELHRQYLLND